MKKITVSGSELKVLNILFDKKEPTSIPEILVELKKENIEWLNPTVSSYLKRLEKKGVVASIKKGVNRYFYTIVPKEQIENEDAKKIIDMQFQGSLVQFLSAFTSKTKLSKKEIEEIREWVNHLDDDNQ